MKCFINLFEICDKIAQKAKVGIIMKELEVIGKKIKIYKIKLLLFMAIAGGSWVYALKLSEMIFIVLLFGVFLVSCYGVSLNTMRLSDLQFELEGINNG